MDTRADVLMQIWKDYYDEILDVDLDKGTYESLISNDGKSNKKGFMDIEVLILANKSVHPDDRQALIDFFDQRKILERMKSNTFVNKLNFRMHNGDGKYYWVKVKGIMPSRKVGEDTRYFACFRILDNKSDEDMSYRQMLKSTVLREKEIGRQRREKLEQYTTDIRTPLSGILGITAMAKSAPGDEKKQCERIEKIEKEANRILGLLDRLTDECCVSEDETFGLDEKKLNEIIAWGKSSVMMRKHGDENTGEGLVRSTSSDDSLMFEIDENISESVDVDMGSEIRSTSKKRKKKNDIPKAGDFNFTGRRFLIVEDDEVSSDITKEMVEMTGAEADIACNGQEAVKKFIANPSGYYDIVLLNLVLPDIDGYSVARCIRLSCKDDADRVMLIAVSAMNIKENSMLGQSRINGFVSKPLDYGMLFMRLSQFWPKKEC